MTEVREIHYGDMDGILLWTEPMIYKRLWSVGQNFITDHKEYLVKRVSLADGIQQVNIISG